MPDTHKFQSAGGMYPNTCEICGCFENSANHEPVAFTPIPNNDIRHEAAGNLAFLLSVIRCGESLSEAEQQNVRQVIRKLQAPHEFREVLERIEHKINQLGESMSTQSQALTDLQGSVTALQDTTQKVATDVTAAVADIKALGVQIADLQAAGGATPDQLAALKTSIDSITASLQGSATSLEGALPPAAPTPGQ